MDYTYNQVNPASLPLAPAHAMQFGTALQRILQKIAYCNPTYGPPLMAKIDLADGYYRIPLSPMAALELAVVLPNDKLQEPLIGLPLSLPMGWSYSPPYFCAFTETCTDLANNIQVPTPDHPYKYILHRQHPMTASFAPTAIMPYNPRPPTQPLNFTDVYIDDFMVVAQHPRHLPTLDNLLHHLNTVFTHDPSHPRKAVVSESKVQKGDATFETHKRILGWDVDTSTMELHLPVHRQERLQKILSDTLRKSHSTRQQWQQLLGELCSMTLAIHSTRYLFSILQFALTKATTRRFRLSTLTKQALRDWQILLKHLQTCAVPITMVVPHAPHYWAATDASKEGIGGFWLPSNITPDQQPCVWRHKFSDTIARSLITQDNLHGTLCNSDLELAAVIVGHATQNHHSPPTSYRCTYIATDNSAAHA
jgi:hypothetical protein